MEFTILNQLIGLVKSRLKEHPSSRNPASKWHYLHRSTNEDRPSALRVTIKSPPSVLSHPYSRMENEVKGNELSNLKSTGVLKTTTTEVRVDRIERVRDDGERYSDKKPKSPSTTSSEVYVIENNNGA